MKLKKSNVTSQLLIAVLAGLVMVFMLQVAQAQSQNNQGQDNQAQVLQTNMPQKTLAKRIIQNTSLSYYTNFLGPTLGGAGGETYNVFLEGNTSYQSFHAANLRYQFNQDWALSASLAAINAYGETGTSQRNGQRGPLVRDEFFNARATLNIPSWVTKLGTLFTAVSYEAPTSIVSRRNDMRFGYVLGQSFAWNLPSTKWTSGLTWQYYRMVYENNIKATAPANFYFPGSYEESFPLQTTVFNVGPYLNYRYNDKWGANSMVIFDWDQRGNQTNTASYNNNLPHRGRVGVSYYPSFIKQITNIGVFTQALLKYTTESHVFGAELSMKF